MGRSFGNLLAGGNEPRSKVKEFYIALSNNDDVSVS